MIVSKHINDIEKLRTEKEELAYLWMKALLVMRGSIMYNRIFFYLNAGIKKHKSIWQNV